MNLERNELILAVATEGFWDMDLEADRAYFSPRYCELVGCSPDDTVFDSSFFESIIHPDDRDRVVGTIGEHVREGNAGILVQEYRMICRDGTVRWIEGRGRIIEWDEHGAASRMVGTITDISDRKNAEKTLLKSQDLLNHLSLQVPGILFQTRVTTDGEFSTPYASAKSHEIYELSPEEICSDISAVFQRFHPEDHDRVLATILESVKTLTLWKCEYRVILPRQGLKWLYGTAQPQALEDGSIVMYGIIMDISDRKHEEELLRLSERKFSTVFSTSPDAVILTRKSDGKYLELNEGFAAITGYTIEEAVGRSSLELNMWVDPADRDRMTKEVEEHGVLQGMEIPFRRKDGSVMVGQMSACALEINGESCLLSVVRDVTKQKEAFQALRASEKYQREILDAIPVCMAITDGNSIEYINSTFVQNFGYPLEDMATLQEWFLHAYPDPGYREPLVSAWSAALENARTAGSPVPTMEAQVTCKNGTVRHTLANTQIINDRILVIFTDITEREIVQKELLKILKLESLGLLAGGIAHDFNNILTAVIGNISFAKMLINTSRNATEALERAEKASLRAADLARQLLVFAKGGHPIKKNVRLEKVVDEAVSLVLSGTTVKGVIDIPTHLHAVKADEGQINQSFHNIIINAIQAMPGGGRLTVRGTNVSLDIRNSFGLPAGNYVEISFTDEGCGISEDDQKKIFDPYFTTKVGGSGLGLASTFAIIAKHGGHISVSSTVGRGTTFSIYLPSIGKADPDPDPQREATIVVPTGGKVLVMDDEEMVRDLACTTLRQAGYAVETCENGEAAIALYRAAKEAGTPFTVTIMDLTIPGGMGGVEAARCILTFDPEAALIVSSGYSDDPVMANFKRYGFCAAIEKPYTVEEILRVVGESRVN